MRTHVRIPQPRYSRRSRPFSFASSQIKAPPGARVVAVRSGGNVNLDQLRGLSWN